MKGPWSSLQIYEWSHQSEKGQRITDWEIIINSNSSNNNNSNNNLTNFMYKMHGRDMSNDFEWNAMFW